MKRRDDMRNNVRHIQEAQVLVRSCGAWRAHETCGDFGCTVPELVSRRKVFIAQTSRLTRVVDGSAVELRLDKNVDGLIQRRVGLDENQLGCDGM